MPALPSASTPSTPTSPESSVLDSEGDLDPPPSDLNHQRSESEPVIPNILYEAEAEKKMVANLRASFRDRQHKRLFEPIEVVAPPTKRSYPEEVHEEPIIDALPIPVPHPNAAGSSSVSIAASPVRMETCPAQDGALDGLALVEEDLDQKDASSSILFPN